MNLTITVPNYKMPSRNKLYAGGHWSRRSKLAREVHKLVRSYAPSQMFTDRVDILVKAYYADNYRRDSSNVDIKIIEDGLKGKVIQDDDTRYVRRVSSEAITGADTNKLEIVITKING